MKHEDVARQLGMTPAHLAHWYQCAEEFVRGEILQVSRGHKCEYVPPYVGDRWTSRLPLLCGRYVRMHAFDYLTCMIYFIPECNPDLPVSPGQHSDMTRDLVYAEYGYNFPTCYLRRVTVRPVFRLIDLPFDLQSGRERSGI